MVVTKQAKGGQANAAVVVESGTKDQLLRVGKGCVDHFLHEFKAAFCYVFGSSKDFSRTTWNTDEGLADECWIWYLGVPLSGGEYLPMEMGPISYSHCPGRVYARR